MEQNERMAETLTDFNFDDRTGRKAKKDGNNGNRMPGKRKAGSKFEKFDKFVEKNVNLSSK